MRWLVRILLLVLVLAIIYGGTAMVSLKGLVQDARRGDPAAVMARVDLPRLRRSLADQIVRAYFARIEQGRSVKSIERVAAPTIVDALVEKLLTPENIVTVLRTGLLRTTLVGVTPDITLPSLSGAGLDSTMAILKRLRPKNPVQLQIMLDDAGQTAIRMHFQGVGWKVSGLDLPQASVEKLIASIPLR